MIPLLPEDFPGLHEEAARMTEERVDLLHAANLRFWPHEVSKMIEVESRLLRDLSRRGARVFWAHWLAVRWGKPEPAHHGLAIFGRGWQLAAGAWGVWILPDGPHGDEVNMGEMHNVICVPALADLDPLDPALLPDGSRRVDALALRAVLMHTAGVADAR